MPTSTARTAGSASRGIGVQPSEFAKLAVILFTAMMLERRMESINDLRASLVPIGGVAFGLATLIFLEPDFGTAVALTVTVGVMLFAAGLSYRYILGIAVAALPDRGSRDACRAVPRGSAAERSWTPVARSAGAGLQAWQSLMAVGSGASPAWASATRRRSWSSCPSRTPTSSTR